MTTNGQIARRLIATCLIVCLAAGACAGTSDNKAAPAPTTKAAGVDIGSPASTRQTTTTSAPAGQAATVAAPAAYAVGSLQRTYVDRTRKTKQNGSAPGKPERTLPTLVLYPAKGTPSSASSTANAEPQPGPWPLVVFSHGVTAKGGFYATTLRVLASAGYVVIAPDYPLSNRDAPGGPSIGDVAEQTRDIAFLIDQMTSASKTAGSPLTGMIDATRIGIAGHSLGAITSLGAGFNACCADRRIKAVAEWAGVFFPLESKGKVEPSSKGRPLLIVHGDQDGTVPYRSGQAVYKLLGAPKYFITLPGAGHIPPYLQGLGTPQSKVVTLSTIDFFDRYLKDDKAGIDRLHEVVATAGRTNATEQEVPS